VRIAVDIDSTLHHYWDTLEAIAKRRFGVQIPYERQTVWDIDVLRPEQVRAAVDETHRPEHILAAEPYPGAVETLRAWHEAGHFIHVTSHRRDEAYEATRQWLDAHGFAYDELYCSTDKVAHAVEIGIDLLVDDKPADLLRAIDAGMTAATLLHPWNREICEEEDIVCAPDWPALRRALQPTLEPAT
jgi:phosphoglycolate phosphatase-like HAD superfamily hydrolase